MDVLAAFSRHCSDKRARMPPSMSNNSKPFAASRSPSPTARAAGFEGSLWSRDPTVEDGDGSPPQGGGSARLSSSPTRLRVVDAARLMRLQREEQEVHDELTAAGSGSAPGEGLDGMEMLGLMLELMGER